MEKPLCYSKFSHVAHYGEMARSSRRERQGGNSQNNIQIILIQNTLPFAANLASPAVVHHC